VVSRRGQNQGLTSIPHSSHPAPQTGRREFRLAKKGLARLRLSVRLSESSSWVVASVREITIAVIGRPLRL
jgi:hypothetical protein